MIARALIALLALAIPMCGQQRIIEWWSGSYDGAFEEATRRNVPVLVAFIQDGEEANERIVSGLYTDPTFIKLCGKIVPMVTGIKVHKPKKQKIRGKIESVCSRFGAVKCSRHKALELDARSELWPGGMVKTPAHIWVLPSGKVHSRLIDVHPSAVFVDTLRQIQRKIGPGISASAFRQGQALLEKARKAAAADELTVAMTALTELRGLVPVGPLNAAGQELRTELVAKVDAVVKDALRLHERGESLAALRKVEGCLVATKGSDAHRRIKKLDASIRRSKTGRAAVRVLRAEAKVRPLLERALGFEKERDYVRAARAYAKVVSRAHGSGLAKSAANRLDVLGEDEDIAPLIGSVLKSYRSDLALRSARDLIRSGDKAGAKKELQTLISTYPKSPAARRARKLLEKGL